MDNTTIIVNKESMGHGDPGLGGQLLLKCLHQLSGLPHKPHAIVFYNAGVKLLVSSSPVLNVLHQLEREGVELIACGICVDFCQLRDSIAAGRVSDMREIVTNLGQGHYDLRPGSPSGVRAPALERAIPFLPDESRQRDT